MSKKLFWQNGRFLLNFVIFINYFLQSPSGEMEWNKFFWQQAGKKRGNKISKTRRSHSQWKSLVSGFLQQWSNDM